MPALGDLAPASADLRTLYCRPDLRAARVGAVSGRLWAGAEASGAGSARQLDDAVLLGVGGEPGLALLGGGGAELRRDDEREREREGGPHCC